MKDGHFELLFGGVFGGVGLIIFVTFVAAMSQVNDPGVWIGIIMGGIFALVGFAVIFAGLRKLVRRRRAIANGQHLYGKVWAYDADHSTQINGMPLLIVRTRFFDSMGKLREEGLATGVTSTANFPVGSTVELAEYEGEFFLVSNKGEMLSIQRENELLDPMAMPQWGKGNMGGSGITVSAQPVGGAINVACPSCGRVSAILPGTTIICPCGRQYSLTQDHMIV